MATAPRTKANSFPGERPVTPEVVREHNLTVSEHQRIVSILGREPTLTELGIFSALWSEHCSYKHSKPILKKFPTQGPQVVQGPGENAGVLRLPQGWAVAFKIESHNHPSAVEPFGGAATGVGGVIRDILCNEVPLIFRTDIYATASLAGALLLIALDGLGMAHNVALVAAMVVIVVIRLAAIRWHIHLPRLHPND